MIRPLLLLLLLLPASLGAQGVDTAQSRITFAIRNLGVQVEGRFGAPRGTAVFQPDQPGTSRLDIRVPSTTIATGIALRDRHLRGEDYFDVAQYPELRFVSSRITCNGNACSAEGTLSIKMTAMPIRVPFTATRVGNAWRLTGSFTVNRRAYGIGGWSPTLSDEATVTVVLVIPDN